MFTIFKSFFNKIALSIMISLLIFIGAFACGTSRNVIVVGSTDPIISLDPAGSYDKGSWTILNNVFARLLNNNNDKLVNELAESCNFTDNLTYSCKLKEGLKFSNGDPLTSKDVKFSFDRIKNINDFNGPGSLFETLNSVETPNDSNVIFKLKEPDSPFPYKIAVTGAGIVDSKVYSPDKLRANNQMPVGAGQYELTHFKDKEVATFRANEKYVGDKAVTSDILVKYYAKSDQMKNDLKKGDLDLVINGLTPRDVESLKGKDFKLTIGNIGLTTYLAFNNNIIPKEVRQSIAYLIDRDNIGSEVYFNTVKPQYSMVNTMGNNNIQEFKDRYGDKPSVENAKKIMSQAKLNMPYPIDIWWTPSHYGAGSADEYLNIKRQLEKDGVFVVNLKSTEWSDYLTKEHNNQTPAFQIGWNVDYPNAEDQLTPFFGSQPFLNLNYNNQQIRDLLDQYVNPSTTKEEQIAIVNQILPIVANDAPIIPIWNQGNLVLSNKDVGNVMQSTGGGGLLNFAVLKKNV